MYHTYSRSSPKPFSFFSSLLSDPSWTFLFFITCFPLQSLAICPSLSYLKHVLVSRSFFLHSAFFCHVSILVTIEALRLPIFKVLIGLSNVHWLSLSTILLWQPLDTQGLMILLTSKPQSRDIMWDIHKRTQQGVSAKLESYIYKTCLVRATNI